MVRELGSSRAVSSVLLPVIQNHIALFADDSKCSGVIESLQDQESLQKDLDSLATTDQLQTYLVVFDCILACFQSQLAKIAESSI